MKPEPIEFETTVGERNKTERGPVGLGASRNLQVAAWKEVMHAAFEEFNIERGNDIGGRRSHPLIQA